MGRLVKVLADNSATDVTPAGATITCATIHTDPNGVPDGRCWAGGAGGEISFSPDDGETWEVRAPAPNGQRVSYVQESYYAIGQMEMLAGNVYYTSFSSGMDWVASYTHPNTALVAYRFAAGFGQGFIGFKGPNNGMDAGAPRLRERSGAVEIGPPSGEILGITGLCFDVFEQVIYVADVDPDTGVGRLWRAPTATSGNLEQMDYDHATYGPIRHMIRDGGLPGLLYIAAEKALLKSVDGLETVQVMRNLSGGREGMMIGYGAEHALAPLLAMATIRNVAGTGKTIQLGFNDGPHPAPANWYAPGFDDGAWVADVDHPNPALISGFYDQIPGGTWTTGYTGSVPGRAQVWLYRLPFTLAGTFERARLTLAVDEYIGDATQIYINGRDRTAHLPPSADGPPGSTHTIAIDPTDLLVGDNLLALYVDGGGGPSGIQLLLEVNF